MLFRSGYEHAFMVDTLGKAYKVIILAMLFFFVFFLFSFFDVFAFPVALVPCSTLLSKTFKVSTGCTVPGRNTVTTIWFFNNFLTNYSIHVFCFKLTTMNHDNKHGSRQNRLLQSLKIDDNIHSAFHLRAKDISSEHRQRRSTPPVQYFAK